MLSKSEKEVKEFVRVMGYRLWVIENPQKTMQKVAP